jgi:hypothetical protein
VDSININKKGVRFEVLITVVVRYSIILRCNAVQSIENQPTFWGKMSLATKGSKCKPNRK